jgi:thioredoxin-related protein
MIKIEKVLLFAIVLVFLVGVASATETPQEDQSYTNDDTVVSDISTVSQDNKIINNEEKKVLDENPQKKCRIYYT